jgi:hypothetical protein
MPQTSTKCVKVACATQVLIGIDMRPCRTNHRVRRWRYSTQEPQLINMFDPSNGFTPTRPASALPASATRVSSQTVTLNRIHGERSRCGRKTAPGASMMRRPAKPPQVRASHRFAKSGPDEHPIPGLDEQLKPNAFGLHDTGALPQIARANATGICGSDRSPASDRPNAR